MNLSKNSLSTIKDSLTNSVTSGSRDKEEAVRVNDIELDVGQSSPSIAQGNLAESKAASQRHDETEKTEVLPKQSHHIVADQDGSIVDDSACSKSNSFAQEGGGSQGGWKVMKFISQVG